jgi:hypothetical protein
MNPSLREQVVERAVGRCEYCRILAEYDDEVFCIDHVIAKKHHGPTLLENLAYCCYWCNTYKGDNLSGFDSITASVVRLFNPRLDDWLEHFAWQGPTVIALTDIGRVTVDVLCMNAPIRIELRRALLREGMSF